MRSKAILLGLALAACGRAESLCPFLNAATAVGLLGGPVMAEVTAQACRFRLASDPKRALTLEVTTVTAVPAASTYEARCSGPMEPLRAIGNEAFACRAREGSQEVVTGRVRKQVFVVQAGTREIARKAAEHLAGNLF